MAMMLAPYNNSMRLGQGFNSYTQQICLDKAALPGIPTRLTKPRVDPLKLREGNSAAPNTGAPPSASSDGSFVHVPAASGAVAVAGAIDPLNLPPPQQPAPKLEPDHPMQVMPWVKPQIVTYSSRFVDKLSDVTDAMNISGSLSIKTATIGGSANGKYVDSDKFKSSDINFHLQVKVTNQLHDALEYNDFNKIDKIEKHQFPEVYGDCFISGWEEGGELNAVISMMVHDKAKVFEIKANLEAEMNTPTLSGGIEGEFGMTKNNLSRSTETTISVTWSGGGSIKDPTEDWTIASLKKAAAAFPDLVAITPQRTYAILTKYTALASFHDKKDDFSPLDYESAGIYTRALLDHYMDYKAMWKAISHATYELKGGRATIELAKLDDEMYKLASIEQMPLTNAGHDEASRTALTKADEANSATVQAKAVTDPTGQSAARDVHTSLESAGVKATKSESIKYPVFSANFAGLIHARKVCRFEMAKIVNEVDLVAKNPKLSTHATRDAYFLNPLVFEQLLPIVRSLSPDSMKRRVKDPNAALLLGYMPPPEEANSLPPVYDLDEPSTVYALRLQSSMQSNAWKAQEYLMRGVAGIYTDAVVHSRATLVNDLDKLNATYRPLKISVWSVGGTVQGLCVEHSKGNEMPHGKCEGEPSHVWELNKFGSEIITEVVVKEGLAIDKKPVIASITMATSDCRIFDSSVKQEKIEGPKPKETKTDEKADAAPAPTSEPEAKKPEETTSKPPTITKTHRWSRPEGRHQWSLRGFFSFSVATPLDSPPLLCTLGVVWGKDAFVPLPMATVSPPICRGGFLSWGRNLQDNVRRFKTLDGYSTFVDKFVMGRAVATGAADNDAVTPFNSLDVIDVDWTLRSLAFASQDGKLTGLKVEYANGQIVEHGIFERQVWNCDVKSELVVARLTAGKKAGDPKGFIDTIEFIRANEDGEKSVWPLAVSTLRYLGEGKDRATEDMTEVVEQAPKTGGHSKWTIRGFYGETSEGIITRLGVIWGRG